MMGLIVLCRLVSSMLIFRSLLIPPGLPMFAGHIFARLTVRGYNTIRLNRARDAATIQPCGEE
jgi:hypothetical protein